jgi:menaquinone-9 beta-reductase
MLDVLIAGAGPAGSIAAIVLARAGARVLIIDREVFPRDKLCGDTLNPGALNFLASLGLRGGPLESARPLLGMIVSGPRHSVRGMYSGGAVGRAVTRRAFDAWLLTQAIDAGARFESGWVARAPLFADTSGSRTVRGLALAKRGQGQLWRVPAIMTIAADGGRSAIARHLGLTSNPQRPRRWAFGSYASGVAGVSEVGEMHVRSGHYVGIAPLTDVLANVCVVTGRRPGARGAIEVIRRAIADDPALAQRFEGAQFAPHVRVLGPLAVDARAPGVEGLLLAGDAAGFVDPMTGDGLHLAMRSGVLAAEEALHASETGDFAGAVPRLARARQRTLGTKLRFNRALRFIAGSASAIQLGSYAAIVAPGLLRRVVNYAGDVGMAVDEAPGLWGNEGSGGNEKWSRSQQP